MIKVKEYKPKRFMENIPFFSVIIVSYNSIKTLPRTLKAIRRQTFRDYEIVLVDNGSTDGTEELIQKFISHCPNNYITHVRIDINEGLPQGRNVGIENAHGQYLIFNDADDWMEPTCLAEMYKATDDGTVDRVIVQIRDISSDGRILQVRDFPSDMSRYMLTLLQGNALRKTYFDKYDIRVPDTFMDDMYVTLSFSARTSSYALIQKPLYNFLINYNSTSGINSITDESRILSLQKDLIDLIMSIRNQIPEEDWVQLEYQYIKCYYNLILNYNRKRKLKDVSKIYSKMHKNMLLSDKYYLKNKNIKIFGSNGDRLYGKMITFFASKLEKCHLFVYLLYVYVLLSKLIYFRI